jgi:pimeloyl-ACP methyl ester carboxylesterase
MTSTSGDGIEIPLADATLHGDLDVPPGSSGVMLFAHGSGSSRHSPRNRQVAQYLRERGLGTLLFDLLTAEEERLDEHSREYRFDIPFLAARLGAVTTWLTAHLGAQPSLGYFGASTGAAAALVAAARTPQGIDAIVSRGGRPDLAGAFLEHVRAPTLLLVGGHDPEVALLNQSALVRLQCEKQLLIVHGATHLFEEPGTLEKVAQHAADWFVRHLGPPARRR